MVNNRFRWDFIGLSTDEKPTPANSEKVVDGSTYYCSDTSKLYVFCKDTWYEKTATGGGGTTYTAGDNITISDGVISATDTTYSNFTGTDGTAAGTAGLVPAPTTTDAGKFLKADGTWDTAGGGGPTVVQTTGNSKTDVMSQDAVTKMVFEGGNTQKPRIGWGSAINAYLSSALGPLATVTSDGKYSVALGAASLARRQGEVNIGTPDYPYGYNNTHYRLLGGVHDGQDAHDAVTVEQVNGLIDAINTALNINIPHIGATS